MPTRWFDERRGKDNERARELLKVIHLLAKHGGRWVPESIDAETAAAVSVMRKVAEQLHQNLAGTKHVTDDFAVLAIDDHGDVDGLSVPD